MNTEVMVSGLSISDTFKAYVINGRFRLHQHIDLHQTQFDLRVVKRDAQTENSDRLALESRTRTNTTRGITCTHTQHTTMAF